MSPREDLRDLLVERSVRLGDFTLASGAKSDYYIDARRTTMSAQGQLLLGQVAYAAIRDSGLDPTHVGGLTLGADPVAYAIAHRSAIEGHPIDAFTVRKRAKDHGTGQRIEGGLTDSGRVLMVEDTMTTGRSTMEAVEAVRTIGAAIVGVLTVVNRAEGSEDFYRRQGLSLISLFSGTDLLEAARSGGG
ncbi:MAG: orotate phosphoribosyltransferase [Gemmatimonadetes bacterium]|nr:orotate phosphoribosyltransferase [Gemmatimonadota bacterium]NNF11730.1 orotate phosphoribosyltransferase [Gemmatimonadota bacterium]